MLLAVQIALTCSVLFCFIKSCADPTREDRYATLFMLVVILLALMFSFKLR